MLTELFLKFALIGAEWVMWVLVILSFISGLIMLERGIFFGKRKVDVDQLRLKLSDYLDAKDFKKAAQLLKANDSMEARVVLFGLRHHERGSEAVEDLMSGALATEKTRYERGLTFLGTVGNNAPFIGLFGTVLGIIGAFDNLSEGSEEAARQVMSAISEALVATGVGLLVAIPAVIAFNIFKSRMKKSVAQTDLLGRTLLSHMRGGQDGGV
jgi:biopolymer transport protein ExbB/TolQ